MSLGLAVHHGTRRFAHVLVALLPVALGAACVSKHPDHAQARPPQRVGAAPAPATSRAIAPTPPARPDWRTGDFDTLLEHRMIRLLVPYSPTLFYHDRGHARGVIAAAVVELEKFLNKKFPDKRPFTVVTIPTTRDRLLQGLIDGEGDVAGGSLKLRPRAWSASISRRRRSAT